ncbi:hypothetical protein BD626DRAFT_635178 [Schizophyllum amplum]|uniref:F-box domain-containing protein n=1 Tax=Schizophyllum amplum TaxID=97359 RepID=A0A550BX46_9AGAR|nr:hypothetical protein BD626DRAFT_635178 [Auriculariopsis ampla]
MAGITDTLDESVSHEVVLSAGARVASTYELFFRICKLLVDDAGLSALLNPAIACRAMSDVALDILWEKQIHLGNLFLTIPGVESSWVVRHRWVNVGGYSCPGGSRISPARSINWFRNYAQRIKILRITRTRMTPTSSSTRPPNMVLKRGPILSNAHSINFRSSENSAFETLHIVLQSDSTTTSPVPSARDSWVSLVYRYTDPSTFSTAHHTIGTFASLANIRTLTISPGENYEAIPHLRGLPFLENLHLIDFTSGFSLLDSPPTPQPGFRALRSLELSDTRQFDYAREVVRFMSSEPLHLYSFKHLEFGIDASLHVSTGRAAGVRSARLFTDLRVFNNISTAVIYVNHDGADLDSALETFTAAWPSLTHLHFVNRLMDFDEVTLEGLVPLATRCPALSCWKYRWTRIGLHPSLFTCRSIKRYSAGEWNWKYNARGRPESKKTLILW